MDCWLVGLFSLAARLHDMATIVRTTALCNSDKTVRRSRRWKTVDNMMQRQTSGALDAVKMEMAQYGWGRVGGDEGISGRGGTNCVGIC